MARVGRGLVMGTLVAGNKKGNGESKLGNGYSEKGGRHLTAAMMGTAQSTRLLALRLERGG
jgi:hypothetical protein